MNHFILDFSGIKSLLALHQYMKEVFHLPDHKIINDPSDDDITDYII